MFLHTWAIFVGMAAISLPLVIHWLTRPNPRRLPLSTIRFVLEVLEQKRARHRLRDAILLALRVAAVALLALAFAQPILSRRALVSPGEAGGAIRVVVLDQSQSMAAVSHGIASFERARAAGARYLEHQAGARVDLVLAAARPRAVFDQPSSNFAALRDELAAAAVLPQRLDAQAAINRAVEIFAAAPSAGQDRRELVILSDFQRTNWANVDLSAVPKGTRIQLESAAPGTAPANMGILRVGTQGRLETGQSARLEVDVGNYSGAARDMAVDVQVGAASYRLSGICPPRAKTTLGTEIRLRGAGWEAGEAKMAAEDALAADNIRAFVLHVQRTPRYLLVTRQPGRPHAASSHFLERAIAPRAGDGQAARVARIDPMNLDRDAAGSAEMLVLDHPGKLSQPQTDLLAGLLRRGRALLYVAAEPTDAVNLVLLSSAAGADLKMPVDFFPPPSGWKREAFLTDARGDRAPFAVFGESLPGVLSGLRFGGGLLSRPAAGGLADDVRAHYGDRSAALVITPCGAGMLAVLNADLGQGNLPGSPAFVPLIGEIAGQLLGQRRAATSAPCGEAVAAYLPTEAGLPAGLRVVGPNGAGEYGQLAEDGGSVLWRWSDAGKPGVYRVNRDMQTVFALATAVPDSESDLTPLEASVLTERLAAGQIVQFRSSADEQQRRDDAWMWPVVACAACIVLEWIALRFFRT